jgi:purine nucleoside permease
MARIVIFLCILLIILLIAFGVWSFFTQSNKPAATHRITPKILTVTMDQDGDPQTTNTGEASAWVQNDKLDRKVDLVGGNGPVYCNAAYEHCFVITGVGVMNASATLMALGLRPKRRTSPTFFTNEVSFVSKVRTDPNS